MAITRNYKPKVHISDGETTRLNFDFYIFKKDNLKVKIIDSETKEIKTLNYNEDYSIENKFNYYDGGYVNLNPETVNLKENDYIVLYRETDKTQEINLYNLQSIAPKNLTAMFDKLTALVQENKDEYYRSLKYDYEDISLINQNIPLDEQHIKTLSKDNETNTVALTLYKNKKDNKWYLGTSKLDPDRASDANRATPEEAIDGTDNNKFMTSKTTMESINNKLNTYTQQTIIPNTIFQYEETFNYSIGQPCYALVNNEPIFYYSIKNDNIGNNPAEDADGEYWKQLKFGGGGVGLPLGSIIKTTFPTTNPNLHLPDGTEITKTGGHKEFYFYMLNLKDIYPGIFCTLEEYNESISNYGICAKYVITEDYIKLPTLNGWIESVNDINELGKINEAGLPNITGEVQYNGACQSSAINAKGALKKSKVNGYTNTGGGMGEDSNILIKIDASDSSSIYGNSNTVQPKGVKLLIYIVIGNGIEESEEKINIIVSNIQTETEKFIEDIKKQQDDFINSLVPNTIRSYLMPDYTSAIDIKAEITTAEGYTTPEKGVICLSIGTISGGVIEINIFINDVNVGRNEVNNPTLVPFLNGEYIVDKDDIIKITQSGNYLNIITAIFCPFKNISNNDNINNNQGE